MRSLSRDKTELKSLRSPLGTQCPLQLPAEHRGGTGLSDPLGPLADSPPLQGVLVESCLRGVCGRVPVSGRFPALVG